MSKNPAQRQAKELREILVGNYGQIVIGVRDDTGNLVNALTVDGAGKAVLIHPDYKIYMGSSSFDVSKIAPFGGQLVACQDAATVKTHLGITG